MNDSEFQATKIRHFIYVAQPQGKPVYAVMTLYWETDAINAVGQIWSFTAKPAGGAICEAVVSNNDDLCSIWSSPEGNLWVGSCDGHVWTTAAVAWDASEVDGLLSNQSDRNYQWKGTEAVRAPEGTRYNIAAIWGSSDCDVHFGTFQGSILHWNGKEWRHCLQSKVSPIQRMHGTSAGNIWAVGRDGLVLHFDGSRWQQVPLPGDAGRGENLTGVWALSDSEVYICSTSGAIFHGSERGLERLGEYPYPFYGIVEFNGDMYLAAGDSGVCVLRGNVAEQVKSNFAVTGVYRLPTRLAFVEPSQPMPRVIFHDPTAPKPWFAWQP